MFDFCLVFIVWGSFNIQEDFYFYFCKFYDFMDGVFEFVLFCEKFVWLYLSGSFFEGKIGFYYIIYNGDLFQDSIWYNSLE